MDKIHYSYKLCILLFDIILSSLSITTIYREFKSYRVFYKLTNCNLLMVHILKDSVILLILNLRIQLNTVDDTLLRILSVTLALIDSQPKLLREGLKMLALKRKFNLILSRGKRPEDALKHALVPLSPSPLTIHSLFTG